MSSYKFHTAPRPHRACVRMYRLNLMINLMDNHVARISNDEGDAFPFEKARIIAEVELRMTDEDLSNRAYFPRWIHVLARKDAGGGDDGVDDWQGTVQAIRAENTLLERKSRLAVAEMANSLRDDVNKMERRFEAYFSSTDERQSQRFDALNTVVGKLRTELTSLARVISEPRPGGPAVAAVDPSTLTPQARRRFSNFAPPMAVLSPPALARLSPLSEASRSPLALAHLSPLLEASPSESSVASSTLPMTSSMVRAAHTLASLSSTAVSVGTL